MGGGSGGEVDGDERGDGDTDDEGDDEREIGGDCVIFGTRPGFGFFPASVIRASKTSTIASS
jgi:hypothetical protein